MFTVEEVRKYFSREIRTMRKAAGLRTKDESPEEINPEVEERLIYPNNIRRTYHF